jgi:hypothetical protein
LRAAATGLSPVAQVLFRSWRKRLLGEGAAREKTPLADGSDASAVQAQPPPVPADNSAPAAEGGSVGFRVYHLPARRSPDLTFLGTDKDSEQNANRINRYVAEEEGFELSTVTWRQ